MSSNGPVKIRVDSGLANSGAASNVATNQATAEALKAAGNVDGKSIEPEWVKTRGITLAESLRVGSGVTILDGTIDSNMIGADQVNATHIHATGLTATDISFTGTLSGFNITSLGSITGGSLNINDSVTIGSAAAGIYIGGGDFYAKTSGGATTVHIDGSSGIITATAFAMTTDTASFIRTSASGARVEISDDGVTVYNSSATAVVTLAGATGITVNNASASPGLTERLTFAYAGSERAYLYAYNNDLTLSVTNTFAIDAAAMTLGCALSLGGTLAMNSNSISGANAIGCASLSTSGAISCGATLDMTQGAISNATTITGSNCAVYALHLARDSSYKANTTFTFYAASSSGGSPTVLHTVTFKDGLITSWSAV